MTQQFSPMYIPKNNENMCSQKLGINDPSGITHNDQKVGATKISINWCINEQNVVYNEISFSNKKEWCPDIYYNMDEHQKTLCYK